MPEGFSGPHNERLDRKAFQNLLRWLDPDREQAGRRYEEIRRRLIQIFASSGCAVPEELADETINRVALKAADIAEDYSGDPSRYFYGVAKKVRLEYYRKSKVRPVALPDPSSQRHEAQEILYDCLERCLEALDRENRNLILHYYRGFRSEKIDNRKALAERHGIALNALRIRAFRIRNRLRGCVDRCQADKQKEVSWTPPEQRYAPGAGGNYPS